MSNKKKSMRQLTDKISIISSEEKDRLRRDIYRADTEKLKLFTQMLRTNNLLKRAKVTHQ